LIKIAMEETQRSPGIIAVKQLAGQLEGNWLMHQGRRAIYVTMEVFLYLGAVSLLLLDLFVISKGHRLLLSESKEGTMRATAYVEDERVTAVLLVGYVILFLLAIGCYVVARMIRSSRKRRNQVQRLCEAIRGL